MGAEKVQSRGHTGCSEETEGSSPGHRDLSPVCRMHPPFQMRAVEAYIPTSGENTRDGGGSVRTGPPALQDGVLALTDPSAGPKQVLT